jgi:hypothetical protein
VELLIVIIVAIVLAVYFFGLLTTQPDSDVIRKIKKHRLIYCDDQAQKTFQSAQYKIRAKPDFIYEIDPENLCLLEYKARSGGVYPSDIAQLIATAIAVIETYSNVTHGYVYTRGGKYQKVQFGSPNDTDRIAKLVRKIQSELNTARTIKSGKFVSVSKQSQRKCQACGFHSHCDIL